MNKFVVSVYEPHTKRWHFLMGNIDAPLSAFHTIGYAEEAPHWAAYALDKDTGRWVYLETYLMLHHAQEAIENYHGSVK